MERFSYVVIGAGVVGLSAALQLAKRGPRARVLVLEKESAPARHQTGRNSGVIHSGIYYKPGSYKARFAQAGAESMVRFCAEYGIAHELCGKLIVATSEADLPGLERLHRRGIENGVPVERIAPERAKEIEPHVQCLGALLVRSTAITDYGAVAQEYVRQIEAHDGVVMCNTTVLRTRQNGSVRIVVTSSGDYEAGFVVNCSGLHSDRIARASGTDPQAKIVPFRGEYYELVPERRGLVKSLIYPVPDPDFPFLGVHFTRMIGGGVHAGPNAVLAFAREGYRKTDFNLRDFAEIMTFSGFWRLARKHGREGLREVYRSLSKAAFTRSLQRLIPEVRAEDLVPCDAGVRAQALTYDGALVDDFLLVHGPGTLHVCNAPSPAATASLEIGAEIARRVPDITPVRGTAGSH